MTIKTPTARSDIRAASRCANKIVTADDTVPSASDLLNQARDRLDRFTDALRIIANWRDDLLARLDRTLLRFELIGLQDGEFEQLVAEIEDFKRTCQTVAWRRP